MENCCSHWATNTVSLVLSTRLHVCVDILEGDVVLVVTLAAEVCLRELHVAWAVADEPCSGVEEGGDGVVLVVVHVHRQRDLVVLRVRVALLPSGGVEHGAVDHGCLCEEIFCYLRVLLFNSQRLPHRRLRSGLAPQGAARVDTV
eukprot:CAMPEP_0173225052 /NCGR_PEP_ID=MMETSP1142-20121109/4673_1 /TAXON_ID=483371 /ORGANISM="non described non described, Strain CCMP2298" /LENGTH=144 /DNA_ID=CAMNT_0014153373 /DNA_START=144 /DNA_END=578 /DNA_ORIENTATION=-